MDFMCVHPVCGSVLQHLQNAATYCNTLQHISQHTAATHPLRLEQHLLRECINTLQHTATHHLNIPLQHTTKCCDTFQHTERHTATHTATHTVRLEHHLLCECQLVSPCSQNASHVLQLLRHCVWVGMVVCVCACVCLGA